MPTRRQFVEAVGAAGIAAAWPRHAAAQSAQTTPQAPPSTVTTPPRDFGPNAPPTTYFTDPDIVTVDPLFNNYIQRNSSIARLWTGALWVEGPAWSGQGRYLVWSDIPNDRQLRWLEDDGRVTVFRQPSNNSNGNTFDFEGRQLSCEHLARRVVRYEHDGRVTVLADAFNGRQLNSPNDVAAHRDGSCLVHRSAVWTQPVPGQAGPAGPSDGRVSRRQDGPRSPRLLPNSRCPTRTALRSRPISRRCTLSVPDAAQATRGLAAAATCSSSTQTATARRRTRSDSRTSPSTASGALPTACAATWTGTSGVRATPGARSATTA